MLVANGLLCSLVWVAGHLAAYGIALRHTRWLHSEAGILRYHLLSAIALPVALVLGIVTALDETLAVSVAGGAALHGVYSMTFLSLWSCSQGGFSLRLLDELASGPRSRRQVLDAFVRWADVKRAQRLTGLERAGFIEQSESYYCTRLSGRALARALRALRALNHLRHTG